MTLFIVLAVSLVELLFGSQDASIVFAGDAMQHQAQLDAARQKDGSYDYSTCFTLVEPYIQSADLAVVNLETTLGIKNLTGYPCFCSPDSYARQLKAVGFDVFLNANNHTLDRRDAGLRRTISVLDTLGVTHLGTYRNRAERDSVLPLIVDVKGIKVAMLNYTYATNGIKIQGDVVVDYIDKGLIKKDIEKARAKGAELICVNMHWGDEYRLLPNAYQKDHARYLEDLGVDLIIGGHPHVIQPIEFKHNSKYDKDILLVYSLGNFISGMRTRDTRGGIMVKAILGRNSNRKAIVKGAEYYTVFVVPPTHGENKNFQLVPAKECSSKNWSGLSQAFYNSAKAIFDKHNIAVPEKED